MLPLCAYQPDNLSGGSIEKYNLEVSFALNMLSALIWSIHSYPAMPLVEQLVHQRYVHSGPLVLGAKPLKFLIVHSGYKPNCLTTFWTQLTYHFNRRTAEPLEDASPPGCDEPTSRCQTAPSMWTIGRYKPVIPGVTFIRKRCRYHTHVRNARTAENLLLLSYLFGLSPSQSS